MKQRLLLLITSVAAMIFVCCTRVSPYHEISGSVWATSYHIIYRADRNLDDSIQAVFNMINTSLSPFVRSSSVSRINRGESDAVDTLFRNVFRASVEVNRWSGGLFDPTVAPLVNLWGFGYREAEHPSPTVEEIAEALQLVGIAKCTVEGEKLVRPDRRMQFDFSAITKGYGCDLVGDMLRRNGCRDYMVEIGGEIAVGGVNPSGDDWHILVDAPVENDTATVHERLVMVGITDCGMATSGNYRNYHLTDSGKIGHTVNPLTGLPARNSSVLSATVIAENAMMADALATACMAMQPESALAMIDSLRNANAVRHVSALLVLHADEGSREHRWVTVATEGFPVIPLSPRK